MDVPPNFPAFGMPPHETEVKREPSPDRGLQQIPGNSGGQAKPVSHAPITAAWQIEPQQTHISQSTSEMPPVGNTTSSEEDPMDHDTAAPDEIKVEEMPEDRSRPVPASTGDQYGQQNLPRNSFATISTVS